MAEAIEDIKSLLREFKRPGTKVTGIGNVHEWIKKRREACERLGRHLDLENIDKLTEDDISKLLSFDENQTMEARRVKPRLVKDMGKLRDAIRIIVDESRDVKERLNEAIKLPGMGPAVATMILFLKYPDKYPFWSSPKGTILREIGAIGRLTGTFGDKYKEIVDAEERLSSNHGIDLTELDTFLWWVEKEKVRRPEEVEVEAIPFEAEEELRAFLSQHPEAIEKGLKVVGVEHPTDVGNIDLLCSREDRSFLVVELKKVKDTDKAVGQLLRYMGWVKEKLAMGYPVKGLIVTHQYDERLDYASKAWEDIKIKYYAIKFELSDEPFEI